jgi:hypothetical protein
MTLVSIVAPSDLKQGYSLQVDIDGQLATVTCPHDVQVGETFEGRFLKNLIHTINSIIMLS